MLAEISGFFSFSILINCPEAYLSLLTFLLVYQLILAAFVIVARQFCLRRICSFPANLLFPLDPAVTLPIKVNTSCLVCIWKSKDSEWETNGRCCNRWCLRLQVPHLCPRWRERYLAGGEQTVQSLLHPLPQWLGWGHSCIKQQRWKLNTVYVKQQMVALRNLKCYICIYIYISISLRQQDITSQGPCVLLVGGSVYKPCDKLNMFLAAMSQEQKI